MVACWLLRPTHGEYFTYIDDTHTPATQSPVINPNGVVLADAFRAALPRRVAPAKEAVVCCLTCAFAALYFGMMSEQG